MLSVKAKTGTMFILSLVEEHILSFVSKEKALVPQNMILIIKEISIEVFEGTCKTTAQRIVDNYKKLYSKCENDLSLSYRSDVLLFAAVHVYLNRLLETGQLQNVHCSLFLLVEEINRITDTFVPINIELRIINNLVDSLQSFQLNNGVVFK